MFDALLLPSPCDCADRLCQWNGAVKLLPMSLAPNMVTLIGFMFIIANVALLQIMDPGLQGTAPSWVYYSYAFGLWA